MHSPLPIRSPLSLDAIVSNYRQTDSTDFHGAEKLPLLLATAGSANRAFLLRLIYRSRAHRQNLTRKMNHVYGI